MGETFEDRIFQISRLPRAGEELRTDDHHATFGGGAAITAVAAARLGVRAIVVSALPPGARRRLADEHVAARDLRRRGEPHAISVALSTPRDRAFVTFNGVNARAERRLLDAASTVRARAVHFALSPTRIRAWTTLVHRLRGRGVHVSWDFGWDDRLAGAPRLRELIAALDVVFVNAQEWRLYAGTSRDPDHFWRALRTRTVVKLGASGSRIIDPPVRLRVRQVRALDTTGAGDAFDGGYLAGVLGGLAPAACLRLGNRAGAAAVRALGGLDGLRTLSS